MNTAKPLNTSYKYKDYNSGLQKILFLPISTALHEQKLTWDEIVKRMNERGYKYTKTSIIGTQQGVNRYIDNFNYFTKVYEMLGLPPITLEYLIECREIYNKLRPQKRSK